MSEVAKVLGEWERRVRAAEARLRPLVFCWKQIPGPGLCVYPARR
jgi:hypothetical protein